MKSKFFTILFFAFQFFFGQNESLFKRLNALRQNNTTFYNVDGINFVSHITSSEFNEKNLKREYEKSRIENNTKEKDKKLKFENYKITKRSESDGLVSTSVYYFVKNINNIISVFVFNYNEITKPEFERKIIELIVNNKIPKTCISSPKTNEVNFAGRTIMLGGNCKWMNVNNIQCESYGQMNWSVHDTKKSSDLTIKNELKKIRKIGKIISEEETTIIFEGVETKAKKIIFEFTRFKSFLEPNKKLTIFLVSEKVRKNYVSCILSFFNTDNINTSGLPKLLEKVMSIKK